MGFLEQQRAATGWPSSQSGPRHCKGASLTERYGVSKTGSNQGRSQRAVPAYVAARITL
jgi:hypothetical protein